MNKKKTEIGSWIFPIILYFIYPRVGTYFIMFKVISSVLRGVKRKSDSNRNTSLKSDSQYNEIKPHDINFSHDHSFNDYTSSASRSSNIKTNTFETEINVRCPICNADNFINKIPTTCEYCGNEIVKI